MKGFYVPAAFEVIRDPQRCVSCRLCIEQCPNGVHSFDEKRGVLLAEEDRCVDCQRCVAFCPTHALKIRKNDCALRENGNWSQNTVQEIWKQAATGGVLLSSMGNPGTLPVYWDRLLINASQVTNPPSTRCGSLWRHGCSLEKSRSGSGGTMPGGLSRS